MMKGGFYGPINKGLLQARVAQLERDPAACGKSMHAYDAALDQQPSQGRDRSGQRQRSECLGPRTEETASAKPRRLGRRCGDPMHCEHGSPRAAASKRIAAAKSQGQIDSSTGHLHQGRRHRQADGRCQRAEGHQCRSRRRRPVQEGRDQPADPDVASASAGLKAGYATEALLLSEHLRPAIGLARLADACVVQRCPLPL